MHQPLLIDPRPKPLDLQSSIPIRDDLLGHRLPNPGPRHTKDPLPTVQDGEIVPDVEIAGLQHELQLVRVPTEDLLQLGVRGPRGVEGVEGGEDGAGEVRVPADALDLRGAGVRGDGGVDGGLVERGIVVVYDAADRHGGGGQRLEQVGAFSPQGVEGLQTGDERVFALAFEAVPALDLDRVLIMRVVDVRQQDLAGVVIRQAGCFLGVFLVVRGHVEGLVAASARVLEHGAEDLFEHLGHQRVGLVAFGLHVRSRKARDLDNSRIGRHEDLVHDGCGRSVADLRCIGKYALVVEGRYFQGVRHPALGRPCW